MSEQNKLIHQGNLISLYSERVALANGGHTFFDIVKHPGGAVIAAINDDDQICLIKQWRHAIGQTVWELPAGCLEPNEPPLLTAQRELEEEAGITAEHWQALGKICSTPGICDEMLYLFSATGIGNGKLKLDEAEQIEAHWVDRDKVREMVRSNEIIDGKTIALLYRLELSL